MSVYVTDTHPLIWYAANEKAKLSKKVLRVFEKAWANQAFIYVPAPMLWEIALIIKAGQIRLPQPFAHWAAALGDKRAVEFFNSNPLGREHRALIGGTIGENRRAFLVQSDRHAART